jgi:hypothetical protein
MGSLKNAFKKLKVLGKGITSTGCHPAAVRTITEKITWKCMFESFQGRMGQKEKGQQIRG